MRRHFLVSLGSGSFKSQWSGASPIANMPVAIIFLRMEEGGSKKMGNRESIMNRPLCVLRHRAFFLFWVGAFISNTGNWTENAAQSWAVTNQTIGNPHQGLMVEILQFADFCPVLLFALLAGVISDRVNRKTWLIVLQSLACA